MFRALRGRNCALLALGGVLFGFGLRGARLHRKCAIVQIWLNLLSTFYSDGYVYAVTILLGICIYFGLLSTYLLFDDKAVVVGVAVGFCPIVAVDDYVVVFSLEGVDTEEGDEIRAFVLLHQDIV